jgi:hypothetical protein
MMDTGALLCGVEACARELGVLHEATVRKDVAKVNEGIEDRGGSHAITVIASLENIISLYIGVYTGKLDGVYSL